MNRKPIEPTRLITLLSLTVLLWATTGCSRSDRKSGGSDSTPSASPATGGSKVNATAGAGDSVAVDYTGKLEDGTVFDSSKNRSPLAFRVGGGQMIQGFDKGVVGMAVGETRTLTLAPEQAYGQHDPSQVRKIPKAELGEEGEKAQVGQTLDAVGPNGQMLRGRVVKIETDGITLDCNHRLAGKTLIFEVRLVKLRKKAG